ncbi:hypothetical protein V8E36_009322 [Tilletia maclaganii]
MGMNEENTMTALPPLPLAAHRTHSKPAFSLPQPDKDTEKDSLVQVNPPPLDPHNFVSRSLTPFNAEPRVSVLCEQGGFYTPQHLLFHRNRDPLPGRFFPGLSHAAHATLGASDADEAWTVTVDIDSELRETWQMEAAQQSRVFTLGQLKTQFGTPSIVTATLECAGNRRSEMSQVQKTEGIQWSSGVIANIAFAGLSLRTYLLALGIPDPYAHLSPTQLARLAPTESNIAQHAAAWATQTHVHFVSAQLSDLLPAANGEDDEDEEAKRRREQNRWFASSLSLATAMLPSQQCLLSWGICSNAVELRPARTVADETFATQQQADAWCGTAAASAVPRIEPLEHAHGFPLRAVLPGHAGARWVKWIREIRIEREMNASAPMRDDYKMLIPPSQRPATVDLHTASTPTRTALPPATPEWVQSFKSPAHRAQVMSSLAPLMRLTAGSAFSYPTADNAGGHDGDGAASSKVLGVDARGRVKVKGYAVGQDGYAVQSVLLRLVPDDDPALSVLDLRALAASDANIPSSQSKSKSAWQPATQLRRDRTQLNQLASISSSNNVDIDVSDWSWSWTLWDAEVEIAPEMMSRCRRGANADPDPDPDPETTTGDKKWALVLKTVTTAGVEQVQTAPWNLRGFCQHSWPVLRGLRFVPSDT